MFLTYFLAQFLGLMLIILGISLFTQKNIYIGMVHEYFERRSSVYPMSFVGLTLGIFLILVHSVWDRGFFPLIVTLVSWSIFLKSTMFLVLPSGVYDGIIKRFNIKRWYAITGFICIILGLYLFMAGSGGR